MRQLPKQTTIFASGLKRAITVKGLSFDSNDNLDGWCAMVNHKDISIKAALQFKAMADDETNPSFLVADEIDYIRINDEGDIWLHIRINDEGDIIWLHIRIKHQAIRAEVAINEN